MFADIIGNIICEAPNPVLCSFLLVSKKTRVWATAECKRRSPLPHLWDVPRCTLLATIKGVNGYGLRDIIHIDYCLCATLGVMSMHAVINHLTDDLYRLATKIGLLGLGHRAELLIRASNLGLHETFTLVKAGASIPSNMMSTVKYSPSPQIAKMGVYGTSHVCTKLYRLIAAKDIAGIRQHKPIKDSKLTQACREALTEWIVHLGDTELVRAVLTICPVLKNDIVCRIRLSGSPIRLSDVGKYDGFHIWHANDLLYGIHEYYVVLCSDDLAFLRHVPIEQLKKLARKSCCLNLIAATKSDTPQKVKPYTLSNNLEIDLQKPWKLSSVSSKLRITNKAYLREWIIDNTELGRLILTYVPDGADIILCAINAHHYDIYDQRERFLSVEP